MSDTEGPMLRWRCPKCKTLVNITVRGRCVASHKVMGIKCPGSGESVADAYAQDVRFGSEKRRPR